MLDALRAAVPGDAVLLHACCHNPTGIDPHPDQWRELAEAVAERGLLPIFDFAYQGFGRSLDEDAVAVREFATRCNEILICTSYSKNFGLYSERVGGLTAICPDPRSAAAMYSQVKACARVMYSNPPRHGASLVNTILNDPQLRDQWESELAQMRARIHGVRQELVNGLNRVLPDHDFSFIN